MAEQTSDMPEMRSATMKSTQMRPDMGGDLWFVGQQQPQRYEGYDAMREVLRRRVPPGHPEAIMGITEGGAIPGQKAGDAWVAGELQEREMSTCRLVRVIIVDPHDSVPVSDRMLYMGDEEFTELTDQELYFEIPIKRLLQEHNMKRVEFRDKDVKDREEYLEPARIRDLVMTVVQIATF